MKLFFLIQFMASALGVTEAVQCLSCLSSEGNGKLCRKVSEAVTVNCPDSSSCTALVFLKNGKVNVHRGCGGQVAAWNFGQNECEIMSADALLDTGVALYQCRGDQCNNIEPTDGASDVLLLTKAVGQSVKGSASASSSRGSQKSSSSSQDEDDASNEDSAASVSHRADPCVPRKVVVPQKIVTPTKQVVIAAPQKLALNKGGHDILGGDEDEVTVAVTKKRLLQVTTTARTTTTTQASDEDEGEDQTDAPSYAAKPTKPPTTTTTKKRRVLYPENEMELKAVVATENTLRPARRGRTVFDRRR